MAFIQITKEEYGTPADLQRAAEARARLRGRVTRPVVRLPRHEPEVVAAPEPQALVAPVGVKQKPAKKPRPRDILWVSTDFNAEQFGTWHDIKAEICRLHGFTVAEFDSDSRSVLISRCRHEAWYIAKKTLSLSLPNLARLSGNRDHTTILHGIRRYKALVLGEHDEAWERDMTRKRAQALALSQKRATERRQRRL